MSCNVQLASVVRHGWARAPVAKQTKRKTAQHNDLRIVCLQIDFIGSIMTAPKKVSIRPKGNVTNKEALRSTKTSSAISTLGREMLTFLTETIGSSSR